MRVLITGGAGFIGRALSQALLERGDAVDVLDNLAAGTSPVAGVAFIEGDVADRRIWLSLPDYDIVYHLAASFANQRSVDKPQEDARWNIIGTINAGEFAEGRGIPLIYTGSSSSYGPAAVHDGRIRPFEETAPCRPSTPYAVSKHAGEEYLRVLKAPAVTFRLFNVFGPGDPPGDYRNAIPNMVRDAILKGEVSVMGAEATRDFTPIDIVTRVLAEAPGRLDFTPGSVYNLCSGVERSMLRIGVRIAGRFGARIEVVRPRVWDSVPRRVGSNARLREASMDFVSEAAAEFGPRLDRTIDWVAREIGGSDAA